MSKAESTAAASGVAPTIYPSRTSASEDPAEEERQGFGHKRQSKGEKKDSSKTIKLVKKDKKDKSKIDKRDKHYKYDNKRQGDQRQHISQDEER